MARGPRNERARQPPRGGTARRDRPQLRRELESLAKLSGGIAHDLNNLLTIVLGNAELVEESLDQDSDLLPMVQAIRQSAERAKSLPTS